MGQVDIRLLGPFVARANGRPLAGGGRRSQRLLAALALDVARIVPLDRLVDTVWDEDAPSPERHPRSLNVKQQPC